MSTPQTEVPGATREAASGGRALSNELRNSHSGLCGSRFWPDIVIPYRKTPNNCFHLPRRHASSRIQIVRSSLDALEFIRFAVGIGGSHLVVLESDFETVAL